ncbi:MAG: hypothetical protein VYD19_02850, partial [Myxococcota bacterium]|nr:hypothetical protein [Myxococcota bacterium]
MSGDDKNEQSVMLSLDDILAGDPQLSGGTLEEKLKAAENERQKVDEEERGLLEQAGIIESNEQTRAIRPQMGLHRIEIKERRTPTWLLSLIALAGGGLLVAAGIFFGRQVRERELSHQRQIDQERQRTAIAEQLLAKLQSAKNAQTPSARAGAAAAGAASPENTPSDPPSGEAPAKSA